MARPQLGSGAGVNYRVIPIRLDATGVIRVQEIVRPRTAVYGVLCSAIQPGLALYLAWGRNGDLIPISQGQWVDASEVPQLQGLYLVSTPSSAFAVVKLTIFYAPPPKVIGVPTSMWDTEPAFCQGDVVTAAVGQNPHLGLRAATPPDFDGFDFHIESLAVTSLFAGDLILAQIDSAFAYDSTQPVVVSRRIGSGQVSHALMGRRSVAGPLGFEIARFPILANTPLTIDDVDLTLVSGWNLLVVGPADAAAGNRLRVTWNWREHDNFLATPA